MKGNELPLGLILKKEMRRKGEGRDLKPNPKGTSIDKVETLRNHND